MPIVEISTAMTDDQPTYTTLDGSLIREIIRPERQGSRHLSLAEATIAPGQSTIRHRHHQSEEIYYVLSGAGTIEVAARLQRVQAGDAVLIPPGAEHRATCMGETPLRILCACSPPYQHSDTELTEGELA
ncbi:MAG: cupin domain-containing protein [Armatimonadia bacterium]